MEDSKAKMSILKEMRKMAMDDMGEGLKGGLKKVTVAAPDDQGLKQGLDKAEDLVEDMPMDKDPSESPEYEDESHAKLQELVEMCQSPEDLDEKIEFLQQAKEEKFGSSDEMSEEMGQSNPFEGME